MREEDRLASQHGAYDYRVQNARNQRIIEEQRRQREQDYSDQLARQREQQERARADRQRRETAQSRSRTETPQSRSKGKPDTRWIEWSTGWGVLGAIAGAVAASKLPETDIPLEGILASAAGVGIAIGLLWKVLLSFLAIAVIGFVAFQFFGTN